MLTYGLTIKKAGSAQQALTSIRKIYKLEKDLKSERLSKETLTKERKKQIKPLLKKFKIWLDEKVITVRSSSQTGEAIKYTIGQWEKIARYIDCPDLTPDNNGAENAIRPFVLGRKNWLFSGSENGAEASCFMYSLIETAKQNNLNPYNYLSFIFEQAPLIKEAADWKTLLPWNCKDKIKPLKS